MFKMMKNFLLFLIILKEVYCTLYCYNKIYILTGLPVASSSSHVNKLLDCANLCLRQKCTMVEYTGEIYFLLII